MSSDYFVVPASSVNIRETLGALELAQSHKSGSPCAKALFYLADLKELTDGADAAVESIEGLIAEDPDALLVVWLTVKKAACYARWNTFEQSGNPSSLVTTEIFEKQQWCVALVRP